MRFETTATERKQVVKAMEEILSERSKYLGPPSFAYTVGNFTVDREGYVECGSDEEAEWMKEQLAEKELARPEVEYLNIDVENPELNVEGIRNLFNMIHSKQYLLERSLGMRVFSVSDELIGAISDKEITMESIMGAVADYPPTGIEIRERSIAFLGFPFEEDKSEVFTRLATAMVSSAFSHKWVVPDETIEKNEKYYMRVWLVRLGFGGAEGKDVRKVMLQNLKGHTAFRTQEDEEKWKEKFGKKQS